MSYIYIAGPLYGSGHQDDNIRAALGVAEEVERHGHVPFVPHLYFFWNLISRNPRDFWLSLDKEWLLRCHAMLRIKGESPGSVLEERWCEEANIPFEHLRGPVTPETVREALEKLGLFTFVSDAPR